MEGRGGEDETWEEEELWSARGSPATSSADEQSQPAEDEDKVFVAVPEEVSDGRSVLLWALHNLVGDGSKVVIAHVHSPARAVANSKQAFGFPFCNPVHLYSRLCCALVLCRLDFARASVLIYASFAILNKYS